MLAFLVELRSLDIFRTPPTGYSFRKRVRIFRRAIERRPSSDGRCRPLVQMSRRFHVISNFPGPLPTSSKRGFAPEMG